MAILKLKDEKKDEKQTIWIHEKSSSEQVFKVLKIGADLKCLFPQLRSVETERRLTLQPLTWGVAKSCWLLNIFRSKTIRSFKESTYRISEPCTSRPADLRPLAPYPNPTVLNLGLKLDQRIGAVVNSSFFHRRWLAKVKASPFSRAL